MMKVHEKLLLITALAFGSMLVSCEKGHDKFDEVNASSDKANFEVYLIDSPGNYQEVNVEITNVEVHSDQNGWQNLNVNSGVYNLLDFSNGNDTLIASDSLPTGRISQIRLILGDSNTVKTNNGQVHDLFVPSGTQSGIKLQVHENLSSGITYAVTLDFDAARSVHQTGNGRYMLKPVIRTITEGLDGGIKGEVTPAAAQPVVYAIKGSDTASTFADSLGQFKIVGLDSGSYQVDIDSQSPYQDTTITNVSVTEGNVTDIGTIDVN